MATYYVATSGSNSAAGTNAAPWQTIRYAVNRASSGDTVIVKPGTYTQTNSDTDQIKPKNGVTLRAQNYAVNNDGTLATHGNNSIIRSNNGSWDLILGPADNFTIEGFEIRDATEGGAGMSIPESKFLTIRRNWIHDCARPGIICRQGDLILIEANHVNNCATQKGGGGATSGISILRPVNLTGTTPSGWNGYRTIIRRNISHHNIPTTGPTSDGEGIIWDGANSDVRNYTGPGLIQGNICYKNGGPGIRVMEGKDIHVENNTCWSNMQDKRKTTTWGCGLHETLSIRNRWRYNVVLEDSPDNDTHAYQNNNAHELFGVSADSTFLQNVLKGPGSKTAKRTRANSQDYLLGALPGEGNNKLGVNPQLVNPGAGNFALASGSPAIGYGPGGDWPDAGAVQSTTPTVPDPLTVDTAPAITLASVAKSGLGFTYANGTYTGGSGTLSRTHKMQLLTGSTWADAGSLTGGSGTLPTVTTGTQFRIVETATRGSETVENPSTTLLLSPADPFVVATAPTVTPATEAKSGLGFTYANGTYSGGLGSGPTRTHQMQLFTSGAWTNSGSALTGGSGTFPSVSVVTPFRVLETATRGTETVANPSATISLNPADDPGTITTLEQAIARIVALETRVGSNETLVSAHDNRLSAIEGRATAIESQIADFENRLAAVESTGGGGASETATQALSLAQSNAETIVGMQESIAVLTDRAVLAPEGSTAQLSKFWVVSATSSE